MRLAGQEHAIRGDRGYAMAALLVGLSVMAVLMGMALPVWSQMAKREKEEELIWRGQQYARAVGLFMRKFANTFPPSVDVLVEQRFLRKKYKDPITNDDFQLIPAGGATTVAMTGPGAATPGQIPTATTQTTQSGFSSPTAPSGLSSQVGRGGIQAGFAQGSGPTTNLGIQGVVSKSKDSSIKIYNGRTKYNEWAFVYLQTAVQAAGRGGAAFTPAGGRGGRGSPGGQGFPGAPGFPGGGRGPGGPGFPGPNMPGGRGFQPMPGQQVPFGQPGQSPFMQPSQPGQSPFGQPMQPGQMPFGQPMPPGQSPPVFGQPVQPSTGRGTSTRPPG